MSASASVPGNQWTDLQPANGHDARVTVSIVIPAYTTQRVLDLTLAALVGQTYPARLVQVVVVDDGTEIPLQVPASVKNKLDVRLLRQEHDGFGAARARNLGAAEAEGEILVFLDADIVLSPAAIAEHAGYAQCGRDIVTMGRRVHSDFDAVEPDQLMEPEGLRTALTSLDPAPVGYIEEYLSDSEQLQGPGAHPVQIGTTSNIGLHAEAFTAVGGFRDIRVRGVEDKDLVFRLFTWGAVMLVAEGAQGWHQGRSYYQRHPEAVADETRRRLLSLYLPYRRYRSRGQDSAGGVPYVTAVLPRDADERLRTDLMEGTWADLRIVTAPVRDESPYEDENDIFVVPPVPTPPCFSPFQIRVRPDVTVGPSLVRRVIDVMERDNVGMLRLRGTDGRLLAEAVATRAANRAGRLAAARGGAWDSRLSDLFAAKDVAGEHFGLRDRRS